MADLRLTIKNHAGSRQSVLTVSNWNEDEDCIFIYHGKNTVTTQTDIKNILTQHITENTPILNIGLYLEMWVTSSNSYLAHFLENAAAGELTLFTNAELGGTITFILFKKGQTPFDVSGVLGTVSVVSQRESPADGSSSTQLTNELTYGDGFVCNSPVLTSGTIGYLGFNQNGTLTVENAVPQTIEIVQTLDNCTCDTSVVTVGESATITVTANEGYEFDKAPTFTVNGVPNAFTVSADRKTAAYTYTPNGGDIAEISATAVGIVVPPTFVDIVPVLTNCSLEPMSAEVGKTTTLTLTPTSGYKFKQTPTISINGTASEFTITGNSATFEYAAENGDAVTVTAVAEKTEVPAKTAAVVKELDNVSMSPDISVFTEGDDITLTLAVADGYEWSGTPTLLTNAFDGAFVSYPFTLSDGSYVLKIPQTPFFEQVTEPTMTVRATAEAITPITSKYGIVTLFKPTGEQMVALSKNRYENISTGEVYDLGQFITSLKSIPLDVPTTTTGDIVLGKIDTGINAPIVDNDEYLVDLGEAELQGEYGNALDFEGMEIEVVLPYIGVLALDASKCAGKKIGVKYRVNLISGECVALITSITDGGLLLSQASGAIGFDVPYILKSDGVNVVQQAKGEILFNSRPAVNVWQRLKAMGDVNIYNTKFVALVGSLSGYNRASAIVSVDNYGIIMDDEMREIERILLNGVII